MQLIHAKYGVKGVHGPYFTNEMVTYWRDYGARYYEADGWKPYQKWKTIQVDAEQWDNSVKRCDADKKKYILIAQRGGETNFIEYKEVD